MQIRISWLENLMTACLSTKERVLGFKKNKMHNRTLIAKLSWMVASKNDSLCLRLLRNKQRVKED